MKKILVVVLALLIAFSFAACKKESEAPIAPGNSEIPGNHPPVGDTGQIAVPQERQVVIPDDVKGKWKSIVLNIEDKTTSKTTAQNVDLGSEYKIPGSDITIKALDFLPDFIMEGAVITSRSAEMNNPAARISVTEGGEEIFSSWIYANHPAIHPFQHEKYGVTLKEAVK